MYGRTLSTVGLLLRCVNHLTEALHVYTDMDWSGSLQGAEGGPGQRVMGRQKVATDACRKRAARKIA